MALAKIILSGSTYGQGIAIAATAIGSGTTIHQASATTTQGLGDEVILYACNTDTVPHTLTIGFGGTGSGTLMTFTINSGVTTQVLAGLLLQNGLIVYGAADSANKINVFGFVVRAT